MDGRPYYRGIQDDTVYLFFTTACGGLTFTGWGVFNRAPDLSATTNLNGEDGIWSTATMAFTNALVPPTTAWYPYCAPPNEP